MALTKINSSLLNSLFNNNFTSKTKENLGSRSRKIALVGMLGLMCAAYVYSNATVNIISRGWFTSHIVTETKYNLFFMNITQKIVENAPLALKGYSKNSYYLLQFGPKFFIGFFS